MAIPVAAIAHALEIAAAIASNPESMKKAVELADSATKVITAGAKTAETAAEVVSPVAKKAAENAADPLQGQYGGGGAFRRFRVGCGNNGCRRAEQHDGGEQHCDQSFQFHRVSPFME